MNFDRSLAQLDTAENKKLLLELVDVINHWIQRVQSEKGFNNMFAAAGPSLADKGKAKLLTFVEIYKGD